MRSFLPFLALPLAILPAADVPADAGDPHAAIQATPIPLDLDAPTRRVVGALEYVAGWQLRSDHPRFGGISSMTIVGDRLIGLSDEGWTIAFTLGRHGPAAPRFARLPVLGFAAEKLQRDTESMTRDPVTGTLWVGTENRNAIWRFGPGFGRAEDSVRPAAMRGWPLNGGPEAMVRLRSGRFIVIAEKKHAPGGTREAVLFAGDPVAGAAAVRFRYRPGAGCDPSDATELPDARVLVLERCVSLSTGVAAALRIVDPRTIRHGGILRGAEIARLARPYAIDNMEALAITRERTGTMVWIASDDNFMLLQRTLLLKFRLAEARRGMPAAAIRPPASSR